MKTSEHNMNHTGEMEQNGNGEIKRHLLLVEDDKASLLYYQELVKFMESPGIEICLHVVTSGEEAVAYCSKYPVDIVLLDIRLPGMDGWETAQQIKDLEPQITVIAQTGYSLSGHYQKSLDSGCDHYLAKPVPMDKFIDTISRYL